MLGKAIWRLRIQENPSAAGGPPRPRWGSLQRSRKLPSWWGGAGCPPPRTPSPALGPSGLSSPTPHSKISSDAVGCISTGSMTCCQSRHPSNSVKTPTNNSNSLHVHVGLPSITVDWSLLYAVQDSKSHRLKDVQLRRLRGPCMIRIRSDFNPVIRGSVALQRRKLEDNPLNRLRLTSTTDIRIYYVIPSSTYIESPAKENSCCTPNSLTRGSGCRLLIIWLSK